MDLEIKRFFLNQSPSCVRMNCEINVCECLMSVDGVAASVTDMRMSCALSRSLLLAELMKMPSSSAVEPLDSKRLCRPTRPFQPRPGELLQLKWNNYGQ